MYENAALPAALASKATGSADELALVLAAREDPVAFGALYERYRDRMYWYLQTRTPSSEDAADLLQQVFLQALDALAQYRPQRGPFVAWLFGIARHAASNFHRRYRSTVAWDLVPEVLRPSAAEAPEADILHREDLAHLRTLFNKLDPEKREALVLRYVAGLTTVEIAAVIGKSEAATKQQLARTLRTLKEQYHDTQ